MFRLIAGVLALALIALAGAIASPAHAADARFNEVTRVATHNSYWFKRINFDEPFADGVRERLVDQLGIDATRAIELDLKISRTPHDFDVYHDTREFESNSHCSPLRECLRMLNLFHYANPQHEPITVILEAKELTGLSFDSQHTPADLDAGIREIIGVRNIYSPADLLSRCAPGADLTSCVQDKGWPTAKSMRGKFVFAYLGSWCGFPGTSSGAGVGPASWAAYATAGSSIRDRLAFPMEIFQPDWKPIRNGDETIVCRAFAGDRTQRGIDRAVYDEARRASVFLQVEDLDQSFHDGFVRPRLEAGFVVRGAGSYHLEDQRDRARRGYQFLQTDYPWLRLSDIEHYRPLRSVVAGATVTNEPGHRLFASRAVKDDSDARARYSKAVSGDQDWETLPSVSVSSDDIQWRNPRLPRFDQDRGAGCIVAETNRSERFEVCRTTFIGRAHVQSAADGDNIVTTRLRRRGKEDLTTESVSARTGTDGAGEMVRLRVRRDGARTCVEGMSSARTSNGAPVWRLHRRFCLDGKLVRMGLESRAGDVLFLGTKHNGAYLRADGLTTVNATSNRYRLIDHTVG